MIQSLHPPSVYIKGGSEFVETKVQSLHPPSVYIKGDSEFVEPRYNPFTFPVSTSRVAQSLLFAKTKVQSPHPPSVYIKGGSRDC